MFQYGLVCELQADYFGAAGLPTIRIGEGTMVIIVPGWLEGHKVGWTSPGAVAVRVR